MSTSPSPATQATGSCVVCGKATVTRCSACAKHGTDWMYFCSIDHQKLIWKVHKRVCGDKSNPFQFPFPSEDEIQRFTMYAQIRVPLKSGATISWCDRSLAILTPDQLETMREFGFDSASTFEGAIRTIGRDLSGVPHPIAKLTRQMRKLRCDSWKFEVSAEKQASGKPLDVVFAERSGLNPFGHLAYIQEHLESPEFNQEDQVYTEWWSRFNHLALIRLEVASILVSDPSQEDNRANLKYARGAIRRFIDSTPSEVIEVVREFLHGRQDEEAA